MIAHLVLVISSFLGIMTGGLLFIYRKRIWEQEVQQQLDEQQQKHQQTLVSRVLAAQDEERKRFAADLHDVIGGDINTLMINLYMHEGSIKELKDYTREELKRIANQVREISYNLMPAALKNFGLSVGLEDLCKRLNKGQVIQINYQYQGESIRFDFSTELNIYRIVQELLTNAIKHASANNVLVRVAYKKCKLSLVISDDGIGFDPASVLLGSGVENVRMRASLIGASIDFNQGKEGGTNVILCLNKQP